jgi:hypothetical protein
MKYFEQIDLAMKGNGDVAHKISLIIQGSINGRRKTCNAKGNGTCNCSLKAPIRWSNTVIDLPDPLLCGKTVTPELHSRLRIHFWIPDLFFISMYHICPVGIPNATKNLISSGMDGIKQ